MSALQKILDKPYGTRTLLEQCISDAVTLEDEHDGDYTQIEKAADQLAQMQAEIVALKADITLREQATRTALDECAAMQKDLNTYKSIAQFYDGVVVGDGDHDKVMLARDGEVFLKCFQLLGLKVSMTDIQEIPDAIEALLAKVPV